MDRYRITPTSNGIPPLPSPLPTQRAAAFIPNPSSQISLPPKPHLRDPPISPYLHAPRPNPAGDRLRHASDDSEISIFDAKRYFKEDQQDRNDSSKKLPAIAERRDLSPKQKDSSSSLDGFGRNSRSRSFHATPTASSEASWNSQTGLLRNPPGSLSVSVRSFPLAEQRKSSSSSPSSGRRRRRRSCPCSDRKSVDVEENHSDPKTPVRSSFDIANSSSAVKKQSLKTGEEEVEPAVTKVKVFPGIWPKENEAFRFSPEIGRRIVTSGGFSFPVLAPPKEEATEDPARDSLEVFRPSDGTASPAPMRKSADFQKRATSLLDGVDRRSFTFPGSPKLRAAVDDDLASDTSSDLFEIESLSTQITCRWRDSLDDFEPKKISGVGGAGGILQMRRSVEEESVAPSIAPSECYAPSEVSVQWSVTTAEGFDRASIANFSSAVSEYEELRYAAEAAAAAGEGRRKGIGGGGLLSCRSEKAVSVVAPNLLRFGPETQGRSGASVFAIEPDRVLGVAARVGAANPVRDSSGLTGSRPVRMTQSIPPLNARVY